MVRENKVLCTPLPNFQLSLWLYQKKIFLKKGKEKERKKNSPHPHTYTQKDSRSSICPGFRNQMGELELSETWSFSYIWHIMTHFIRGIKGASDRKLGWLITSKPLFNSYTVCSVPTLLSSLLITITFVQAQRRTLTINEDVTPFPLISPILFTFALSL